MDAGELCFLMYVNPEGGRSTRIGPDDRVMSDDSPGRVPESAEDRIARVVGRIEKRCERLDLVRPDDVGVDALQLVDLGTPAHGPQ